MRIWARQVKPYMGSENNRGEYLFKFNVFGCIIWRKVVFEWVLPECAWGLLDSNRWHVDCTSHWFIYVLEESLTVGIVVRFAYKSWRVG